MWLIFISMAASLAGCGDSGNKFVGEWSCESPDGRDTRTFSIRHNGGNNYIYDSDVILTYSDGILTGSNGRKLAIDKQTDKLIGRLNCKNSEMSRVK
jgi:hypothetical protein